jgi:hypothetical protein
MPKAGLGQQIDEGLEVGVLVEHRSSVITPVQDVVADVGARGAGGTRHRRLAPLRVMIDITPDLAIEVISVNKPAYDA